MDSDKPNTPAASQAAPHVASPVTPLTPAFYCPDNYQPNESVGYLMRRVVATVTQCVERELEPAGLTNAQWVPLVKLHMGLASTAAELARECDLDAGSMTRLLDRLETKALVRRSRSADDRRVVNLELTDAGSAAARDIPEVLCGIQNQLLVGFSADEWQTLKGYLRRMLDSAQRIHSPAEANAAAPTPTPTQRASAKP